jgi:hypothetical protein
LLLTRRLLDDRFMRYRTAVESCSRGTVTSMQWVDASGHVWTIATRMEETTEEERQARLSRIMADSKK